jgi:hypothetical protein
MAESPFRALAPLLGFEIEACASCNEDPTIRPSAGLQDLPWPVYFFKARSSSPFSLVVLLQAKFDPLRQTKNGSAGVRLGREEAALPQSSGLGGLYHKIPSCKG